MKRARRMVGVLLFLGSVFLMGMEQNALDGLEQNQDQSGGGTRYYTVSRGDCLSSIAARLLGDPYRWPELYELNKDQISDPNLIYPDQVLKLPEGASTAGTSDSAPQDQSWSDSASGGAPPASNGGSAASQAAAGGVTTRSPQFAAWFQEAQAEAEKWGFFPDITNQYGEKVTRADFIKAIIYIESRGVHRKSNGQLTTSCCGAQGFMQLMPGTASGLGVDGTDPRQNLLGGVRYLGSCLTGPATKNSGDSPMERMIKGACGYNTGPYRASLKNNTWTNYVNAGGTENVGYGICTKMCLGLSLTANEKSWLVSHGRCSSGGVDSYARSFYAGSHGLC